jgi:hypothetical protein
MRNPSERLRDILDAIANIERYSVRGREAFEQDELIRIWICTTFRLLARRRRNWGEPFTQRTRTYRGCRLLPCGMYWCMPTSG